MTIDTLVLACVSVWQVLAIISVIVWPHKPTFTHEQLQRERAEYHKRIRRERRRTRKPL